MKRALSTARFLVLVSSVLLFGRVADAQETINLASVSGRIVDQQGLAIPGARVAARQTQTNLTVEATTDTEGRFRFPYLKIGPWTLTVSLQGFADVKRSLTLGVASAFELPLVMKVAGVDTNVNVAGEVPVIETARSQIAGTVPQAEVQSLPMNGRNFLDLALLIPGVSPSATSPITSSSTACPRMTMQPD